MTSWQQAPTKWPGTVEDTKLKEQPENNRGKPTSHATKPSLPNKIINMTMGKPIPGNLASLIDGIRWPLDPESCPPLYMKRLEQMREIREQNPLPSTNPLAQAMAMDVLGTVQKLAGPPCHQKGEDQIHYARIATALLLLGHQYTDEAHSLVSPLTWTQPTPFGYGPPVQTSDSVSAVGSYVHALIHRREAFHESEFQMTGFGNAHFWASSTTRGPQVESLPLPTIRKTAYEIASRYPDSTKLQNWFKSTLEANVDGWEPRLVHDLCAHVMLQEDDEILRDFAERVAEAEVRVLLGHVLRKLGFAIHDCLRKE